MAAQPMEQQATTQGVLNYRSEAYRRTVEQQNGTMFGEAGNFQEVFKELEAVYKRLDEDARGFLDAESLQRAMGGQEGAAAEMLVEAGIDGAINYEQFFQLVLGPSAGALQEFLHNEVGAELLGKLRESMKAAKEVGERFQKAFGPEGEYAEPTTVTVQNGRLTSPRLETHGFELLKMRSSVSDYAVEADVKEHYYPEIIELVKQHTGAKHAFLESHIVRKEEEGGPGGGPVQLVHNDFTSGYKKELLATLGGEGTETISFSSMEEIEAAGVGLEELQSSRLLMVNAWKPASQCAPSSPMLAHSLLREPG